MSRFCCYVDDEDTECMGEPLLVLVGMDPYDTTDACPRHVVALISDETVAVYPLGVTS